MSGYVVKRLIGEGGMALVYEAYEQVSGDRVAIKVIKIPHEAARVRLQVEGLAQSSIDHPNVVRVHKVIRVAGSPGLVMEFVDGLDLEQFLQDGPPEVDVADRIGAAIIQGVAAAHAEGVLHRDLKPANVVVSGSPPHCVPKIMDFGLARMTEEDSGSMRVTRTGMTMGTPAFMAPEQIRNSKDVDERADVYSLGVLLYELVSARRAFPEGDIIEVLQKVARGERRPIRELLPDLPERMISAIEGAFEPELDKRIPDSATLLAVWRGERTWRVSRNMVPPRAWMMVGAAGMASLGLVAGAAVLGVVWSMLPPPEATSLESPVPAEISEIATGGSMPAMRQEVAAPNDEEPEGVVVDLEFLAEPPAEMGSVVVEGGAKSVTLSRGGRVLSPGAAIPVGTYTLNAVFEDGSVFPLEIDVEVGKRLVVECDPDFKECS